MSCTTVKLGDVCETASGGTPKRGRAEFYDGEIPWVKSGELKDSLIKSTSESISHLGLQNSSAKIIPKGTLLIAMYGATVGKLGILDIEAASNQAVCAISPSKQVDQKYLFHYLFKIRNKLIERSTGGAQPNISQDIIRNLEIPLPPLDEQRRIAEVLDKADTLRQKRRLALQKLDTLLQSVFLEMFGDLSRNPKNWSRVPLHDVCAISAPLIDPTKPEYRDLLLYGSDRIERNTGKLMPAKTAAEDGVISVKFCFDENAILYSKIRPNLNKVALVNERGLCSADVYPVNVDEKQIRREFLWRVLLSDDFLAYAAGFSNRANIPKINRDQFFGYQTILPPIELQNEFLNSLRSILSLRERMIHSENQHDDLFQSIQTRAFKGELFETSMPSVGLEPENTGQQTARS